MIPADIDTPEVISDRLPQAQTQALSTLNKTTKDQVDQVQKYRHSTIANKVDSSERGTVVNATEDVVRLINAARTQFALHDAKEEESEVADSQNSARVAFRALANSTGKYARTNPGCLSLYEEITQLKAVTSYCLKNVYWFPEEGASSLPTKKRRMS
ncbi:hypothetical protein JG687_00013704 [Phytophthora cactorum]|uniref:Uncharacterized protein n=1 Tax=Phytophthora cactorum TaxID=29920 RepID=A0A8T1TY81_9STRA|nr:hypothetical protein JG687_00013704 [Phytophthora cactorum]